jgi:hypothetical protein
MTERKKKSDAPKRGVDLYLDVITGRIRKITILLGSIGVLVVLIFTQYDKIKKLLVEHGILTPAPPCVSVDWPKFPEKVKLSEWDSTTVSLHGHEDCTGDFGLYMAFSADDRSKKLFALVPPHFESYEECKELHADLYPNCWYFRRPLTSGKGEWSWDVPLPPVQPLSNLRSGDRLIVSYEVRDYDAPGKPPKKAYWAAITIRSDAESPSGK